MRVTRKPNVTAGLKWPPEMCPTAEAITPIASPCASAITVRFPPCVAMIEPAPDEDQRERSDELREPALQKGRLHGKNPRTRGGRRPFEGCRRRPCQAEVFPRRITAETKGGTMSADILKRKIRNFPAANLSVRIAAAS